MQTLPRLQSKHCHGMSDMECSTNNTIAGLPAVNQERAGCRLFSFDLLVHSQCITDNRRAGLYGQ
jgi:hypothetical protein